MLFRSHTLPTEIDELYRVRNFRGRVSYFNQSEARKHCFLASDWLKCKTLPRKFRTLWLLKIVGGILATWFRCPKIYLLEPADRHMGLRIFEKSSMIIGTGRKFLENDYRRWLANSEDHKFRWSSINHRWSTPMISIIIEFDESSMIIHEFFKYS